MKVTVNKNLYARSGEASASASPVTFRQPGHVLDVDDIRIGQAINGNSVWYHSAKDGNFYWSGGTEPTNDVLDQRPDNSAFSAQDQLGIYRSAVNELSGNYTAIDGFSGMAAGRPLAREPQTGPIVLIVYYDPTIAAGGLNVPATINYRGFSLNTVSRTSDNPSLHDLAADQGRILPMGGSIAGMNAGQQSEAGARTLLVTKDSKNYLLACYHVVCNSLLTQNILALSGDANQAIIPAKNYSPNTQATSLNIIEGSLGADHDYALIDPGSLGFSNEVFGVGFIRPSYSIDDVGNAFLNNITLVKYGPQTQQTTGSIDAYHSSNMLIGKVTDPTTGQDVKIFMSGLIIASDMSDNGDSGSPVVDSANDRLVGYIVAGAHNTPPNFTLIQPFWPLNQFSITF